MVGSSVANSTNVSVFIDDPVFWPQPEPNLTINMTDKAYNDMLANGIPALSPAAGVNEINIPGLPNVNMDDAANIKVNGWPRNHEHYNQRWLHSDLKNMAFLYIFKLFEMITTEGVLK